MPKRRKRYGCEMPAAAGDRRRSRRRGARAAANSTRRRLEHGDAALVGGLACVVVVVSIHRSDCQVSTHSQTTRQDASATRSTSSSVSRRRERQRERAREGAVGAGERRPGRGRREAVERVRPDLRLDPLGPQRSERLVAAVELDDVRLPAVAVALGGGRRERRGARAAPCTSRRRARAPASSSSRRASCGIPIAQRRSGSR